MLMKKYFILSVLFIFISCAPKSKEVNLADLSNELNKKFLHGKKCLIRKSILGQLMTLTI